ncbi:MAG: hypothetical protein B6D37_09650 [Sphingobacteriales bacterium UTBCD1]|jgi:hypothetical protein|nr:MAG: hypothetical protein B6D37_09650 [Sphingobacteriales bacterium UTBCD1]
MKLEYKYLLEENLHPDSRAWVFQSNRQFTADEALQLEEMLQNFLKEWKSHGAPVKGAAHLLFRQFIILMADHTRDGLCGSSADNSTIMLKKIEKHFSVNLFDRTMLAFAVNEKVELLPMSQLQYAVDNGFIKEDTLYFNNLVSSKKELENNWIIPVKESWLTRTISLSQPA